MIKIEFVEPSDDLEWRRWREECEAATRTLNEAVARGDEPTIDDALYKPPAIKRRFYVSRDGPFHEKCAYCESLLARHDGDMEHFRPKKGVDELDDRPVRVRGDDGSERDHPGYYWLAYDWRNLLPSCAKCNRPRTVPDPRTGREHKIGKRNRFPLAQGSPRAWRPADDLTAEKPVLINPLEEDPADHLRVDPTTGIVVARSERGQACIDVFGLNVSEGLVEERRRAADAVRYKLLALEAAERDGDRRRRDELLDELRELYAGSAPYTLAIRPLFETPERSDRR